MLFFQHGDSSKLDKEKNDDGNIAAINEAYIFGAGSGNFSSLSGSFSETGASWGGF